MKKNLVIFFILFIFSQIGQSANEHFYLEIKKKTVEIGTFSEKKMKREALASFPRKEIDVEKVSQIIGSRNEENVLFYFHAMWGGMKRTHKKSLKHLNKLEGFDKIISIIWHTDGPTYKASWRKSIHQGENIGQVIQVLTNDQKSNYSVLCHSMGHRIFQGHVQWIDDPSPRFQTILFAAADLDVHVFSNGLHQLSEMSQKIIIMVHEKDRILKISKMLHRRDRLGLHATRHLDKLGKIENLEILNVTKLKKAGSISISNHLYFKKHQAVFVEMNKIFNHSQP